MFFGAYEHTIRGICYGVACELPQDEQALLWLWTDKYIDWNGDDIPYGDTVLYALEDELYQRVCAVASDAKLSDRLERYLYPPSDD